MKKLVVIKKPALSQIHPHWNWNSKLNTKLSLEFQFEYGFKFEFQVGLSIIWESALWNKLSTEDLSLTIALVIKYGMYPH